MSAGDMEKANKAPIGTLTPPGTEELPVADEFETGDGQDQLVRARLKAADIKTLFPRSPNTPRSPTKASFKCDLTDFDSVIESLDTPDDFVTPSVGQGIQVKIHDPVRLRHEPEVVSWEEVVARARTYLELEIRDANPDNGWETRNYSNAGLAHRQGWFFARRLAYQGLLHNVPQSTTTKLVCDKWDAESAKTPPLRSWLQTGTAASRKSGWKGSSKKTPTKKPATKTSGECKPESAGDHNRRPSSGTSSESGNGRLGRTIARNSSKRQRKLSPKAAEAQEAKAHSTGEHAILTKRSNPIARVSKASAYHGKETNSGSDETHVQARESDTLELLASIAVKQPIITLKFKISSSDASQASSEADSPGPSTIYEIASSATSPSPVAPTSPSRKRKRAADDVASLPAKKEPKRAAFDFNDTKEGPPGRFAQAVKHFLNDRSSDAADCEPFKDGKALCPQVVPESDIDRQEKALAKELHLDDQYNCLKYRFFLAAAMLTELNIRIEQHKAAGNAVKTNLLNLNKTQAQLYNNVDVNKSSKLFNKFKELGWIPEMLIQQGNKKKAVNPVYKNLFPAQIRKELLDKLMAYEAEKVTEPERRVVLPSLV